MHKLINMIRSIPYETKLLYTTTVTMTAGLVMTMGKIIFGVFTDIILCAVGAFNLMLLIAKLGCVIGIRKNKTFNNRNTFTAIFLFFGGLLYSVYMSLNLLLDIPQDGYSMVTAIIIATISFTELAIAIYGLIRTKEKGHYYRNIKIISFASSLIAIMTAQIAILSFTNETDVSHFNSYSGIAVGGITMLLAIYVYFAPQISTIDRQHNTFKLVEVEKNMLIDMKQKSINLLLIKSKIYGDIIYQAFVENDIIDGNIVKKRGVWSQSHVIVKIICIILSEILIFVWAIGYIVYFMRTIDMSLKLHKKMLSNGFNGSNTVANRGYN